MSLISLMSPPPPPPPPPMLDDGPLLFLPSFLPSILVDMPGELATDRDVRPQRDPSLVRPRLTDLLRGCPVVPNHSLHCVLPSPLAPPENRERERRGRLPFLNQGRQRHNARENRRAWESASELASIGVAENGRF